VTGYRRERVGPGQVGERHVMPGPCRYARHRESVRLTAQHQDVHFAPCPQIYLDAY